MTESPNIPAPLRVLRLFCLASITGWLAWQAALVALSSAASGWRWLAGICLVAITLAAFLRAVRQGWGAGPWRGRDLLPPLFVLVLATFEYHTLKQPPVPVMPTLALPALDVRLGSPGPMAKRLDQDWRGRLAREDAWLTVPLVSGEAADRSTWHLTSVLSGQAGALGLTLNLHRGNRQRPLQSEHRAANWPELREAAVAGLASMLELDLPRVQGPVPTLDVVRNTSACLDGSPAGRPSGRDQLRSALARAPDDPTRHAALGRCLMTGVLEDPRLPGAARHESRAALNRALTLAPDFAEAALDRARFSLLVERDREDAGKRIADLQARYPHWHAARALELQLHVAQGQFDEARRGARQLVIDAPLLAEDESLQTLLATDPGDSSAPDPALTN